MKKDWITGCDSEMHGMVAVSVPWQLQCWSIDGTNSALMVFVRDTNLTSQYQKKCPDSLKTKYSKYHNSFSFHLFYTYLLNLLLKWIVTPWGGSWKTSGCENLAFMTLKATSLILFCAEFCLFCLPWKRPFKWFPVGYGPWGRSTGSFAEPCMCLQRDSFPTWAPKTTHR